VFLLAAKPKYLEVNQHPSILDKYTHLSSCTPWRKCTLALKENNELLTKNKKTLRKVSFSLKKQTNERTNEAQNTKTKRTHNYTRYTLSDPFPSFPPRSRFCGTGKPQAGKGNLHGYCKKKFPRNSA
jgi:hypothetical protein